MPYGYDVVLENGEMELPHEGAGMDGSWAPAPPHWGDTPQPPGPPAGYMVKPAPAVMLPFLIGYFVCWIIVVIMGLAGMCRKPWECGIDDKPVKRTRLT
eukprot:SAG22_NODE_6925_length_794_cov_1.689209_1_plen_99_part_00